MEKDVDRSDRLICIGDEGDRKRNVVVMAAGCDCCILVVKRAPFPRLSHALRATVGPRKAMLEQHAAPTLSNDATDILSLSKSPLRRKETLRCRFKQTVRYRDYSGIVIELSQQHSIGISDCWETINEEL